MQVLIVKYDLIHSSKKKKKKRNEKKKQQQCLQILSK